MNEHKLIDMLSSDDNRHFLTAIGMVRGVADQQLHLIALKHWYRFDIQPSATHERLPIDIFANIISVDESFLYAAITDSDLEIRAGMFRLIRYLNTASCCEELESAIYEPDPRVAVELVRTITSVCAGAPESASAHKGNVDAAVNVALMMALQGDVTRIIDIAQCCTDSRVKEKIAYAIGELRISKAITILLELLADDDDFVRYNAASSLGKLGDQRAVGGLIKALHDPDELVRSHVIWSLGSLQDASAIAPLLELTQIADATTRWQIAEALGRIGDTRATPGLVSLIRTDPDPLVRSTALGAFEGLHDERIISVLEVAAECDVSEMVRESAREALARYHRTGSD